MTTINKRIETLEKRIEALEIENGALRQELMDVKDGQRILARFIHELRSANDGISPGIIQAVNNTRQ